MLADIRDAFVAVGRLLWRTLHGVGSWLMAVPRGLWFVLAALAGAVVVVWETARRSARPVEPPPALPDVPQALESHTRAVEETALVQKIEASATATAQRDELNQTLAVPDPAERRRRLAALLESLR